jgi:hypothetical protein
MRTHTHDHCLKEDHRRIAYQNKLEGGSRFEGSLPHASVFPHARTLV